MHNLQHLINNSAEIESGNVLQPANNSSISKNNLRFNVQYWYNLERPHYHIFKFNIRRDLCKA
jgi:hypothetical protein